MFVWPRADFEVVWDFACPPLPRHPSYLILELLTNIISLSGAHTSSCLMTFSYSHNSECQQQRIQASHVPPCARSTGSRAEANTADRLPVYCAAWSDLIGDLKWPTNCPIVPSPVCARASLVRTLFFPCLDVQSSPPPGCSQTRNSWKIYVPPRPVGCRLKYLPRC